MNTLEAASAPDPAKISLLPRDRRAPKGTLQQAEQVRQHLAIVCPPGVSQDDVRAVDFWFNVAPHLRRMAIVTLWSFDRSWEMEVCIERVRSDGCEITVRKVYGHTSEDDATEAADDDGKFRVQYRGTEQWCVVRAADGVVVQKNHPQKGGALAAFRASQPRRAA